MRHHVDHEPRFQSFNYFLLITRPFSRIQIKVVRMWQPSLLPLNRIHLTNDIVECAFFDNGLDTFFFFYSKLGRPGWSLGYIVV